MNAGLIVRWSEKGFSLTGSMDDRTTEADLMELIPVAKLGDGPIEINVEGLNRGNSIGMLEWERFIGHVTCPHYYTHAQFWLVNYFNLIANFFQNPNSMVGSFYAPFVCEEDDSTRNILITVGKDLPLQASYDGFDLKDVNVSGKLYVPDFMPKKYFGFLARNHKQFSNLIKQFPLKS